MLIEEANGYSGGIWLFWKDNEVDVSFIKSNLQHITVDVKKAGGTP